MAITYWKGNITTEFLEYISKNIVKYNYRNKLPIIYAEKGIIYKQIKSKRIVIGNISRRDRTLTEDYYTL